MRPRSPRRSSCPSPSRSPSSARCPTTSSSPERDARASTGRPAEAQRSPRRKRTSARSPTTSSTRVCRPSSGRPPPPRPTPAARARAQAHRRGHGSQLGLGHVVDGAQLPVGDRVLDQRRPDDRSIAETARATASTVRRGHRHAEEALEPAGRAGRRDERGQLDGRALEPAQRLQPLRRAKRRRARARTSTGEDEPRRHRRRELSDAIACAAWRTRQP